MVKDSYPKALIKLWSLLWKEGNERKKRKFIKSNEYHEGKPVLFKIIMFSGKRIILLAIKYYYKT